MSNKSTKAAYWISTGLITLFVIPGIFFLNSPAAIEGTHHLGLPRWFHFELGIAKFFGALILILPFIKGRLKEWVYVAFGIDSLSAVIGMISVDGPSIMAFSPIVFFAILLVSYVTYHKLWPQTW